MVLWLGGVYYYPPSEAYFCQFIKLILCPVLLPCWRGVVIFWKRKGILVFGIVSLFALVFPHLHGFIYLWSSMLVTFKWGFCVEVLFVDIDAIHFCLLVLLLTVRPLCCRSAGICWRSTPDPVCLDITSRGCRTTKIAACSFLWKLCPRGAPTRRQLELSCSLCYGSSSVETTGNKIQVYDSFISKHVRIIYKEPRIVITSGSPLDVTSPREFIKALILSSFQKQGISLTLGIKVLVPISNERLTERD
ncbi:lysophosphatidic acid receptor 6 isoform X3 [Pan troglodytes]|uniref:lysophosphatidic acid receptor 6 isoform X3 n=1 Tax=Pan troglodytes TaxID=9598 RepID=UPI0023F55EBB|nr:lysophosphatidic acid receptor 6 isoform X3 [Pan troglodytes]